MGRRVFTLVLLGMIYAGFSLPDNSVFAGITGKIAGRVTEKGSGEPLPGANVVIQGAMMGAATDLDGNFVILNISPGIYSIKASMIGYGSVVFRNIRVSIDLTTEVNFQLGQEVVELGDEVTIVAERPLVQKDMTGSMATVGADEIGSIPVQEINDVIELQAGVVVDNLGNLHIRGGRSGEVAYWIDGIAATDGYDGSAGVRVENSMVQELQVISGTFNAEYGQAMSGIINIVTKEGSPEYHGEITAYTGDYVLSGTEEFALVEPVRLDGSRAELYDIRQDQNLNSVRKLRSFNPLSRYDKVVNFAGNLSGPIPLTKDKLTFFTAVRYFDDPGWMKGMRWFTPQGTEGDRAIVDLNPFKKISIQGKFAYRLTPNIKLSYNLMLSGADFRTYNHGFRYNPDGAVKKTDNSRNQIVQLTHALSATTFYELKASRFKREFKTFAFEDPTNGIDYVRSIPGDTTSAWVADLNGDNTGYVHLDSLIAPDWGFLQAGANPFYQTRSTEFTILKFDLTSQVDKINLIKVGAEVRFHRLKNTQFDIIPATDGGEEVRPFQPAIPSEVSPQFFSYDKKPFEISAYIQDKMEFSNLILNVGLRMDIFDPNGQVLADPTDPDINNPFRFENKYKQYIDPQTGQRVDINAGNQSIAQSLPDSNLIEYTRSEKEGFWFKDTKVRVQLSPRIGIAYPITANGVIHFSYGHFFQIPTFQRLFDRPVTNVTRTFGLDNVLSNPNLKPQKTVMYELGLQQQLADHLAFDATFFFRDIRDWVGTGFFIDTALEGVSYNIYENQDFSSVQGFTFALTKSYSNYFSASLDYSFQVANGSNSNPDDALDDFNNDQDPRIEVTPVDWDQTHTINGSISIGKNNWRVSAIGRYWSGLPFTPTFAKGAVFGAGAFSGLANNSDRRPTQYTFDLRFLKTFNIGNLKYQFFANAYNLFDRRNEPGVYDDSGQAGFTENLNNASSTPRRLVSAQFNSIRPDFYDEPREIQIGVTVGF